MTRFAAIFDRLSGELAHVPQPQKYRILKELADDFEDYYRYYLDHGRDEEEAVSLAELKVTPDSETLQLLVELNRSPVTAFMRRFSAAGQRRIEIAVWVVLACTLGIPLMAPQASLYLAGSRSGYFWPVAVCAGIIAAAAAYQAQTVYIARNHTAAALDRFMDVIPFAGLQGFCWGLIGFFVEVLVISDTIAAGRVAPGMLESMIQSGLSVLVSGALTAVAAGLVWLVLSVKTVSIREHEKAFILTQRKV